MGTKFEPIRCPGCNRIGSPKTQGYCLRCYNERQDRIINYDDFTRILDQFNRQSKSVVAGALMEFGVKERKDIKPVDRAHVINICYRRVPRLRGNRRHIVSESFGVEKKDYYGGQRYDFDENYGIVKDKHGIESK